MGGFGRGEHPYSDIDVLLLAKDEALLEREQEKLQRFITLLWDLKLEVRHSVRTLEDSAVRASDDPAPSLPICWKIVCLLVMPSCNNNFLPKLAPTYLASFFPTFMPNGKSCASAIKNTMTPA